ncbi:MAG: Crp/Fnr family transcriptional regulator [Acidobacteriota bacterium]|nr:Crp/Fnr family transcriptional regulator [Acidobacteriota bacterium]
MGALIEEPQLVRTTRRRSIRLADDSPVECAACDQTRSGWFCSLGDAIQTERDLIAATTYLPAQTTLFTQGEEARCVYVVCNGYLKLSVGRPGERQTVVRVASPGTMLGLYAVLNHGVHEVSAESLTVSQIKPIERSLFLQFLATHQEAAVRATRCLGFEYRFALQSTCRIAGPESVAARLGRLVVDLGQQIGMRDVDGKVSFPQLLTHEEMASMAVTTRETVTRTLGQFRKKGWISIRKAMIKIENSYALESLL